MGYQDQETANLNVDVETRMSPGLLDVKLPTVSPHPEAGTSNPITIPSPRAQGLYEQILSIPSLIWGFTESDFATFVVPNTAFGTLGALATAPLTDGPRPAVFDVLLRLPWALAFNWCNLLVFDLSNQRTPESVREDLVNKPWRPIPSGKITGEQTRRALLVTVPLVLLLDYYLDVWVPGAMIHLITWLYNDVRGMDEFLVREVLISVGYAMFNSGTLQIISGSGNGGGSSSSNYQINSRGVAWTAVISGVILTTMQVQDLKDQEGDRLRRRKTVVLFLGNSVSRGSIALFVCVWSAVCAAFWNLSPCVYAIPVVPGVIVAWNVLMRRSQDQDRRTWKLWCLWLVFLYLLPIVGHTIGSDGP